MNASIEAASKGPDSEAAIPAVSSPTNQPLPAPYVPDDHARALFENFRNECWKRQLSNAENLDRSILTYSSGALGLSLVVLKDFVPIKTAHVGWALYGSWALFTLAIVVTMMSYLLSQRGLRGQLQAAENYYLAGDEQALQNLNGFATEVSAWVSAVAFVIGVVLTTIFVAFNLTGVSTMTEDKKGSSANVHLKEGASAPELLKKGAPIPTIQRLPSQPASQPASSNTPAAPVSGNQPKSDAK